MRKGIILGIGILILLLALAGTGSAKVAYGSKGADCGFCHVSIVDGNYALTDNGNYYREVHKFNGNSVPTNANSCLNCHPDLVTFLPLTSNGSLYNVNHRYNETTLAAKMLSAPGCGNCHVDVVGNNFNLLSGTPTYLTSTVCKDCHRAKYDNWTNTLHRVMLTPGTTAQAMNLPTPQVGWANISYVIVTKFQFAYINTTGYFLAQNDEYNTETQTPSNFSYVSPDNETFVNSTHAGGAYGTCGRCHTTGWNASARNSSLPGFSGTFSEPGIACERCHGPAGNGHQVTVNYSGDLCRECHTGSNHGTGWENGEHAPPPFEIGTSCMFCHSSFDQYKNQNASIANATGVSCGVCHNIHDMTDSKYADTFSNGNFVADTWSEVANAKLGFFNATASIAAGTDIFDTLVTPALLYPGTDSSRKDTSYGTAPITVTGPVSEVLCSKCHYRHGIAHTAEVNLTHSRINTPQSEWATCTDCHMKGTNSTVGKDMMKNHANDPLADVTNSCGGTTKCHIASVQNLSMSSFSMVPNVNEWNGSAHNDKVVNVGQADTYNHFYGHFNATTGVASSRPNTCLKCHSPQDWNPANTDNITNIPLTANFRGITCAVCHNIHDMGDWLNKTQAQFGEAKAFAWYNKKAIVAATNATTGVPTRFKANYTMMANTTALCGNCHTNIREGNTGPGWASATAANPIGPHGFPAADVFAGSWKQTSLLKFECKDCHMATMITDSDGNVLPDSQKVKGHSFKVNADLLQAGTCSSCHVTGSALGNLSTTIEDIQADTHAKWNATNITVISALNTIKAYNGEKNMSRDKIAQAYWNLRLVSSDESWGVHNPVKENQLLDDAARLANEATASLGQAQAVVSRVQLKAGWNLVALTGTPAVTSTASVMSSVSNSITVVWGYNTATQTWELYDPTMPSSLNTLTNIVPGKGYWINAIQDVEWTT